MTRDTGRHLEYFSAAGLITALAAVLLLVSPPAGVSATGGADPAPTLECPSCEDNNGCTVDTCDPATGTCRHDSTDCDDHNSCTTDACSNSEGYGVCYHLPVTGGTACDDAAACTGNDTCNASGLCAGTALPPGSACSDGNYCTVGDTCDAGGQCVGETLAAGTPCDDQDLCTSGDTCVATQSGGVACTGAATNCDDGDLCTVDGCDPSTGECQSTPVNCDDGNSCTLDSCDASTGACDRQSASGSCSDGNFCTSDDICSGGNCLSGAPRNCQDAYACTFDSCDPFQGCRHDPGPGCDDGNPCSTDFCDTVRGCVHLPNDAGCDPNGTSDCVLFQCVRGTCQLVFQLPNGSSCNDNNACTTGETCTFAHCGAGTDACDDGDSCTDDSCAAPGGPCAHTQRPVGSACDDGDLCTTGETCTPTGCSAGAPRSCDDNIPCTVDSCDPQQGCVHAGAPENLCDGVDNDCDGTVDEGRVHALCSISPTTFNLNAQGSSFTISCSLTDHCDPDNPVPILSSSVERSYISRADSFADPNDDVTLPDPSTVPCPDPVLGTLFEAGIVENLSARGANSNGITFRFNVPADGDCHTLDGDRQDVQARLAAMPDGTEASICIAGKAIGAPFEGCVGAIVKNHGLR